MTPVAPIAAILLAVLGAVFAYRSIWQVGRQREAGNIGLRALGAMRWREFAKLVLDALNSRGYQLVNRTDQADDDNPGASEYLLTRDGQRWLLWIKHDGSLGGSALAELGNDIRGSAAAGGLLVTPAHIEGDARERARLQRIELLDGPTLWPELEPLLPAELREKILADVDRDARKRLVLALAGCAALGLAVGFGLPRMLGTPNPPDSTASPAPVAPAAVVSPPPVTPTSARAAPTKAAPTSSPADVAASEPAPTDPAALQQRRQELADAVATLPFVARAAWASQSTLVVFLSNTGGAEPVAGICRLVERYEELRTSRLQLQPATDGPVRFRQCRSF